MAALVMERPMATGAVEQRDDDSGERALVREIARRGDVAAFERLYHGYRRRLGPFMHRFVRDAFAHEEAFNDVMLTVWRKAATYNGTSKVSTWIFSIAYRHCLKALQRRNDAPLPPDEIRIAAPDERQAIERREVVDRALDDLSPEHRLVVELAYFGGHNYREIAAIADCPENTVKTRMFHARRRLREILEALGETASEGPTT